VRPDSSRSCSSRMEFPEPVISVAVEPKTKADQEKMGIALQQLAEEDPIFRVHDRRRDRPDHHRRHGRAAPGHPGGPHAAASSRSRPTSASRRWPTARRITKNGREGRRHATCGRPAVAVSSATWCITPRACTTRPGSGFSSRTRSRVAPSRREYIPAVEAGIAGGHDRRRAGRLPAWWT